MIAELHNSAIILVHRFAQVSTTPAIEVIANFMKFAMILIPSHNRPITIRMTFPPNPAVRKRGASRSNRTLVQVCDWIVATLAAGGVLQEARVK